jgi:outer membrane protein
MKKILSFVAGLSLVVCLLLSATTVQAQRYGIVDTKYILDKMPDYKEAQKNKMYKDFEAEQVMLSEELKKKRENELFNKEKEVRDLQRKRFGFEGDLFKKRQELVKPIQDKVYNAIQKLAVARSYDFILDKSEGITVIFADPKLDRSEDILRDLGVK